MTDKLRISFALTQFFGLYFLIIASIMFTRVTQYRLLVQKMNPESGTILLGGLIGLMLGLFLVGLHSIWLVQPVVVITLICWAVLILSILCLASPERMVVWIRKLFAGSGYYVLALFLMILGLMSLVRGVYIYATFHHSFMFS